MRVATLITTSILFLMAFSLPLAADRGVGSIQLSANPTIIAADGKSICTITAQVRDKEGRLAPDETEIQFSASLGVIQETEITSSGVARVKLVSSDIPGTCVVTATWIEGEAVAQIKVEFGDAPATEKGPDYISVSADQYLAYSIDYRVMEALGNVKIHYRSLNLEAHEVQIDLEKNRIVARGDAGTNTVKINSADNIIEGNLFTCDMLAFVGMLISAENGKVCRVNVSKSSPEITTEEAYYTPEEFNLYDLSDSSVLVKAKEATVFLNEKIYFKKADVYVDRKRMLSLPLYVLSLTGYTPEGEQYVGYSTGGLTLNLPAYYSLSPSSTGALLIRHGDSTGWGEYGQRPGWFVDLQQKYATEDAQGTFILNRITNNDWGAQFSHNQILGNQAQAYLFMDYPAHEDFYGSLSLNKSFNEINVGMNLYSSMYKMSNQKSLAGDLSLQTHAKGIGRSPFKYTLTARLGRSYTKEDTDEASYESSQRLEGNVYSNPLALSRDLSLRTSAGVGYVWGSGTTGLSTLGSAVLGCKLPKRGLFELNYRFVDKPDVYISYLVKKPDTNEIEEKTSVLNNARQTLSAMLRIGDNKKWRASLYAIKGLDYSALNVFANLSYRIDSNWRLGMRSTRNEYGKSSYNDFEISLGKTLGSRELLAVWSKSQKRIMFELGSGGF